MSILQQAHQIVFERNEEKERMYGPFEEGMEQAARNNSIRYVQLHDSAKAF